MKKTVDTVRIPYRRGETIKIKPIADVHLGSKNCDKRALMEYLGRPDPKTYLIGIGDLMDCIIVSDSKRYRKVSDGFESEDIIGESVKEWIDILMPFRDQIIGLGCLSEDSMVLSEHGWKDVKDVCVGEKLLSFNETLEEFQYENVNKVYSYKYTGEMYNLKGATQDQLITPDHSVFGRRRDDYSWKKMKVPKYEFTPAKDIRVRHSIPIASSYKSGTEKVNPLFVKLIGWIITEGCFLRGTGGNGIYIYQSSVNIDNVIEIKSLLDSLEIEYSIENNKQHRGNRTNEAPWTAFYIKAKSAKEIRKTINEKRISREILNNWDFNSLCILRDTMLRGDGSSCVKKNGHHNRVYYTAEKGLAYDYLELCLKTNTPATLRSRNRVQKYNGYEKYVSTTEYSVNLLVPKRKTIRSIKKIQYNGYVYDYNIENNHNFLAMRNGRPFITGNCGNHEDNIIKRCSVNPMKMLCDALGVNYLGYSFLVRLIFSENGARGRTVIIRGHHGWGMGGRTLGGELTKYSKDLSQFDCDIALYGHTHRLQADTMPRLGIVGDKLVSKEKHLVICGTFLKTFSDGTDATYAEQLGLQPAKIGGATISIKPNDTWVKISVEV